MQFHLHMAGGQQAPAAGDGLFYDVVQAAGGNEKITVDFIGAGII